MIALPLINHKFFGIIKWSALIMAMIISSWLVQISEPPIAVVESPPNHEPDYFAINFTATTMNATGKPQYSLQANYLEHFPDDNSTSLRQPYLIFFQQGMPAWLITAMRGQISAAGDSVWLSEQVHISRPPSFTPWELDTTEIQLYPKRQYGETSHAVEIRRPRQRINAIGMRADLKTKQVEFLHNVRGYLLPADH